MLARARYSPMFVLALFLSLTAWSAPFSPRSTDEGEPQSDIPRGLTWTALSGEDKEQALELLSAQTRSNHEKISTWTGSYHVLQEEYLPEVATRVPFQRAGLPPQATINQRDFTLKFATDIKADSIFRDTDTSRLRLLSADEARKPVKAPPLWVAEDQRSVVTPSEYTYHDYKMRKGILAAARTFPEARNTRWAFRVPPEKARRQEYGDLMDPRLFFRCSVPWGPSSQELDFYLSCLRGQKGSEKKRWAEGDITAESATADGKTWYRLSIRSKSGERSAVASTSVWSPTAGFNPVSLVVCAEDAGGTFTSNTAKWRWRDVGGILAPAYVEESTFDKALGGLRTYFRAAELKTCSFNKPIPASTFTIKAFGLEDGDLLADETNQTVYVVDGNGGTTKLAKFNEVYVPPDKRKTAALRWTLSLSALVLLMAVAALVVHKRMVRAKGGHPASATS